MKRFFLSLIVVATLPVAAPYGQTADLVETAKKMRSLEKFVDAVNSAGLASDLKNSGPYTVFAPSNEAFEKLPEEEWNALTKDKATLARLLAHHMIRGNIETTKVKPGNVKTLDGSTINIKSDNGIISIDGVNVTQSDLMADNGVIHEVDQILRPK